MKKILCLFVMGFLSSCSVLETTQQNFYISYWDNCTLVDGVFGDTGVRYNFSLENDIRSFEVQKIDNDVYLSYVLGKRCLTPASSLPAGSLEVRVIKGTYKSASTGLGWDLLFAKEIAGESMTTKVLSLNGKKVVAIKIDNKMDIYSFSDTDPRLGTPLKSDLFAGYAVTLDQINTWIDKDDKTYVSAIADNTKIVIGKFNKNDVWSIESSINLGYNIANFDIKMGENYPYAIWTKQSSKKLILAAYTGSSANPWTELSSVNSVIYPTLLVESYTCSYSGRLQEDVFVGTVNNTSKIFQLYSLDTEKQLSYLGEYISGNNSDYSIASNKLGQVMFVRPDRYGIDYLPNTAVLSTKGYWNTVTHPTVPMSSANYDEIKTIFLDDTTPLIFHRGIDGLFVANVGRR